MSYESELTAILVASGCSADDAQDLIDISCEIGPKTSQNEALLAAALTLLACNGVGGGGASGIDDVLAIAQDLTANRTIQADGNNLTIDDFGSFQASSSGSGSLLVNNNISIDGAAVTTSSPTGLYIYGDGTVGTLPQTPAPGGSLGLFVDPTDGQIYRDSVGSGDAVTATLTNKTIESDENQFRAAPITIAANTTLTVAQMYGSVVYATGAITITLPAVVEGMHVTIYSEDATVKTVEIDGSDRIRLDGTALVDGNTIDSPGAAGDSITLHGDSADGFTTHGASGTWVDGGAT